MITLSTKSFVHCFLKRFYDYLVEIFGGIFCYIWSLWRPLGVSCGTLGIQKPLSGAFFEKRDANTWPQEAPRRPKRPQEVAKRTPIAPKTKSQW